MSFRNKPRKKRSLIWEIDRDLLVTLVSNAESLGQVLKHFQLENKGGNPRTLKARLIADGIDFSHIKLGPRANAGKNFFVEKTPLSEIFVENSTFSRTHLKKRILCEKILENVCAECGQDGMWHGKPLNMVLDHINGVSNDNRLENLRMLCPNCNAQTETFAGKNKRKFT